MWNFLFQTTYCNEFSTWKSPTTPIFYTDNPYFFTTFSKFLSLLFPYFSVDGHLKAWKKCSKFLNIYSTVNNLSKVFSVCFCFFYLILYVSANKFSVMSGWVFLVWTSTKQGLMCLAQGHNAVTQVRLEPATPRFESSTLPLSHCASTCMLLRASVFIRLNIEDLTWVLMFYWIY